MSLYLLRVGADSTKAGGMFWSRIYPNDKSYIFIPIPEKKEKLDTTKAKTYQEYKWNKLPILNVLPNKIWSADSYNQYIHDDPEFDTFTYGSPEFNQDNRNNGREKNYSNLCQIEKCDMLAFYAAFTQNGKNIEGYYFFAYFIVDHRFILDNITKREIELIQGNHHFVHRKKLRLNQVIVKGNKQKSKVLKKAVLLSSPEDGRQGSNYYPCRDIRCILDGYHKSMNRSSIRKFDGLKESNIKQFKRYLDDNGI